METEKDSSSGLAPYKPLPLREHFRIRRFALSHHDTRAFTESWLPLPVFVVYRVLLFLYLAAWMIGHAVDRRDTEGGHWLIYITNWSSILLVITALYAAVLSLVYCARISNSNTEISSTESADASLYSRDVVHWTVKAFWALYITSYTVTVMVTIGYWASVYQPCSSVESIRTDQNATTGSGNPPMENCGADAFSIHAHGISTFVVICDIILSLKPFSALHFLYPCAFTLTYVIFSGIYFAAGGTNEFGDPYIYSLLNYGENPTKSSRAALLLVFLPAFVYIIPFLVACTRDRVYWWITQKHNCMAAKTCTWTREGNC
jgi:hypothetical protein